MIGCGKSFLAGMTKRDRLGYWRKHRAAILAASNRQCETQKKPFVRPWPYLAELEKEHPRRQVGVVEWWGPWTPAGAPTEPESEAEFENDQEFLTRLGLLEPWEVELLKKRKENGNLHETESPDFEQTEAP